MYYDPGKVVGLPSATSGALRSWWNLGFFQPQKSVTWQV
jgi:hypothetical protein